MMGWVNWSRKADPVEKAGVSARLVGLDLTASRVRAAMATLGRPPRPLPLDEPHDELPLAVSLQHRSPEIGRAALATVRRLPHLCCLSYLPALGLSRHWQAGRHRYDAAGLVGLLWEKLRPMLSAAEAITPVLPAYLSPSQVHTLQGLAGRSSLPLRGSVSAPLALTVADPAPWNRSFLLVDSDDHALIVTHVVADQANARVAASVAVERLGLRVWKERLLDAIADRCIRLCRRDPRDSALTEQALFDQLDDLLERGQARQNVELTVRSTNWYQTILIQPDELDAFTASIARQAAEAVRQVLANASEPPTRLRLTSAAAKLPGLKAALYADASERTHMELLPPEALAQAGVAVAERVVRGELPSVHLDTTLSLKTAPLPDRDVLPLRRGAGPAV